MAYTSDEIAKWVLANVRPGCVVHVKGTAKRPAYRLVTRITRDSFGDHALTGLHLKYGYDQFADRSVIEYLGRETGSGFETEHGLHNVSHVITALDVHVPQFERPWPVYRWTAVTIGKAIGGNIEVPVLADRFGMAIDVPDAADTPEALYGADPADVLLEAAERARDAARNLAKAATLDRLKLEKAAESLKDANAAVAEALGRIMG